LVRAPVAFVTGTAIIALTTDNGRNGDAWGSEDMACGEGGMIAAGERWGPGSRVSAKIAFVAAKGAQEA